MTLVGLQSGFDARVAATKADVAATWHRLFGSYPTDDQAALVAQHVHDHPTEVESAIRFLVTEARNIAEKKKRDAEEAAKKQAAQEALAQRIGSLATPTAPAKPVDLSQLTLPGDAPAESTESTPTWGSNS